MKLHAFGVLCSLGILFAPLTNCASTCNNCNNIDCSVSYGSYNQCYRNCCPSYSQCESSCHSSDCRSNCQVSSCQSNCQTSECRSSCQVSQCQSNCQSNLCKSNCEQNRCQSGSCNDYPRVSPCSGSVPCDTPRSAPCSASAPAPCASTTTPCPSSSVVVNGTSCTAPNVTVNSSPNISLPKITVNIHQGAVNVGPIHVQNNFTLSCGNSTAPCKRPPRIVHVQWPHPILPSPPPHLHSIPIQPLAPRIVYPQWIPRPVAPQPIAASPCCQYQENRCVNNACYPQQVTGCGAQCAQPSAQFAQQCPWYGCQQVAAVTAPCVAAACQPAVLPIEPQLPVYGGGYYDASYYQKLLPVQPQPLPETQTAYQQPLPEALPQPIHEPYPQPVSQPYPQPQQLPQPYPQPQPLPQPYPQPQPLPQPYPQPQQLPQPYPQQQPLPEPYPHTLPWEPLPPNCIRIQQWPYFSCQTEPYAAATHYQAAHEGAYAGNYAPSYPEYGSSYDLPVNGTARNNGTVIVPVWSTLSGPVRLSTVSGPGLTTTESDSEESFEYEDDQPESARSNVTRA